MKVFNNPNPIVVIDWDEFEEDKETCEMGLDKNIEDMTHDDIISQIFLEYEEDVRVSF